MIYLETTNWQEDDFKQAEQDRNDFGVLLPANVKQFSGTEYQYPVIDDQDSDSEKKLRTLVKAKQKKKSQKKARKLNRKQK